MGPEAAEVPREAAGEAGGGLRPPSLAAAALSAGGAEAEREGGDERWTFLQFQKIPGTLL